MLAKILKHEFRATGRMVLPAFGIVLVMSVLFNLSVRFLSSSDSRPLMILNGVTIALFSVGLIVLTVMPAVLMIYRFYQNLLKDEGYLMHTLPVSVHGLVWSKILVSLVWFFVTGLLIALIGFISFLFLTETGFGDFFRSMRLWSNIQAALRTAGLDLSDLWIIVAQLLILLLLSGIASCLMCYASLSLGHMFTRAKIPWSIAFYLGFSVLFSLLSSSFADHILLRALDADNLSALLTLLRQKTLLSMIPSVVQCVVLYLASVFGLKRGLNLA